MEEETLSRFCTYPGYSLSIVKDMEEEEVFYIHVFKLRVKFVVFAIFVVVSGGEEVVF